jgi:hypothetical protein
MENREGLVEILVGALAFELLGGPHANPSFRAQAIGKLVPQVLKQLLDPLWMGTVLDLPLKEVDFRNEAFADIVADVIV